MSQTPSTLKGRMSALGLPAQAESHGGREADHRLEFGRMLHRNGFARLSFFRLRSAGLAYFVA